MTHRRTSFCTVLLFLLASPATAAETNAKAYGYKPIDEAEFERLPKAPRYRAFLPIAVDLSKSMPQPGNQGNLNSCTGWAVGYSARSYYAAVAESRDISKRSNIPSPTYIYHATRDPKNCEGGSTLIDAFALLGKGSLSMEAYPPLDSCARLSKEQLAKGTGFKIERWRAVDPKVVDDVKGQLARGNPVVFGMYVGTGFERLTGDTIYKSEDKKPLGHAMTLVGYDDQRQAFKAINSWGRSWGNKGFGWIAYETFRTDAREAYVMEVKQQVPVAEPKVVVAVPIPKVKPKRPQPQSSDSIPEPKPSQTVEGMDVVPPVIPATIERPVVPADCSLTTIEDIGGRKRVSGFVATEEDLVRLKQSYADRNLEVAVEVRPWPQCEVLMTISTALGSSSGPALSTGDGRAVYYAEEPLVFKVTAPRVPSFMYVSYVQADGTVVHLRQPDSEQLPSLSQEALVFGDGRKGGGKFTVSAPYGREMVIVLSSESPLFETPLPQGQTEREYMTALRKAIIHKTESSKPFRKISATFLGLETQATK